MAVSSLDALGVAPEDMTPAEAKELARLMEQVRQLEEGTSTTHRRETPALFTAEEKPPRTRKLQRPKSARALRYDEQRPRALTCTLLLSRSPMRAGASSMAPVPAPPWIADPCNLLHNLATGRS